jgi:hypothetical protein
MQVQRKLPADNLCNISNIAAAQRKDGGRNA